MAQRLPKAESVDRVEFLISKCVGKKVLHIGCADWPYTEERLHRSALLHQRIAAVAQRTCGFDLSEQGIKLLRSAGIDDLVLGDASKVLNEQVSGEFDVVLAGEVIEHVFNAGSFLESIRSICNEKTEVIITTPNHGAIKKVLRLPFGHEIVHPDHVAYYSFTTLNRLAQLHQFSPVDHFYYWVTPKPRSRWINSLMNAVPAMRVWADGIIVVYRSSGQDSSALQ